jgi:hypothetical protein
MTRNDAESLRRLLVGQWIKVSQGPAAEIYPERLQFTEWGTFAGSNAHDSRWHPIWDAGVFKLVGNGKVRLSTANDAEIEYPVSSEGDELIFVIGERVEVKYRKA